MAIGLKRWIAVAVVGCAGLAVWALPPRSYAPPWQRRDKTPEREAAGELGREVHQLNDALRRLSWDEQAREVLASADRDDRGVTIWTTPAIDPEVAGRIREDLLERVSDANLLESGEMRLAVFVVDGFRGGHPDLRLHAGYSPRYHLLEEQNACAVFLPVQRPESLTLGSWLKRPSWREPTSGPCLLYRKFGVPGAEVNRWLMGGGLAFALDVHPNRQRWDPEYVPGLRHFGVQGLFQTPANLRYRWLANSVQACLGGSVEYCRAGFLDPTRGSQRSYMDLMGGGGGREPIEGWYVLDEGPFAQEDRALLADLAAEFGEDRFRAFWSSDAPVEEAFEASFGTSVGAWTMTWAREHLGRPGNGPWPGVATAGLSLLFVVLVGGAGLWVAEKRMVA